MRLLSKITIRIKKGFLPHLTNEVYKRGCEMRRFMLLENQDDYDLFQIEIFYSNKDKFKGLIDKIVEYGNNFQIESFENNLEKEILGGLLNVSGTMQIENLLDYEMKVMGVSELALDMIKDEEDSLRYTGISRNIGLLSGIGTSNYSNNNRLSSYILKERDSIIINRFSGLNAFPIIIKYNQIDDFIKTIQGIEDTFSAIRIYHLEEIDDDVALYDQIYSESSIPLISRHYDEIPVCLLTAIFHLLEKNNLDFKDMNVGFIGLDISSLRITRLLLKVGFHRILGCDNNVKMMHSFEKQGGLATSQENIFSNSDLIILFKKHFRSDDLEKTGSGQIIISLIEDINLKKKGVKEFLHNGWMDLSILFPGILKGIVESKIKKLDDDTLINLSKKIFEIKSNDEIIPDVFSDVHERIPKFFQELS